MSQSAKNQVKQVKPRKRSQSKLIPSHDIDELEVHSEYGDDRLVLLTLDDKNIYAYWEVTDARKGLIASHFGCDWDVLPKVLRVYDVTDLLFDGSNAHWHKDLFLTPSAANWFLRELLPNRNYCVDFGTYDIQGKFFSILRSDVVHTPPGTPHPWKEHKRWKREEEKNTETWTDYFTGYSIQD